MKPHIQPDHLPQKMVNVAVATVWTKPESPRELDRPALQTPVRMREWLAALPTEKRLELYDKNMIQTQVLYGEMVYVLEEQGEWAHVLIPKQPSSKDPLGYPGWIPSVQLSPIKHQSDNLTTKYIQVTAKYTYLYKNETEQGIELSFQTCLPYIKHTDRWVTVHSPDGEQLVKTQDINIIEIYDDQNLQNKTSANHQGDQLVEIGKKFLGLPYLWGGTSSFGYDCSGFVYSLHRAIGVTIPRDASDQAKQGQEIPEQKLQAGDLLFFAYEEGKGAVHHVGMYVGEGNMLHSPKTGKTIEIIPLQGTLYEKELCGARRYWA